MSSVIDTINAQFKKHDIVNVKSGDTVRVHQKIKEGNKERIQVFEGLVIRTDRKNSHTSSITVRKVASGVGVEKTYLLHSPLVEKVEVTKRSKVRRNYLSYMRERTGKSARLSNVNFDRDDVNAIKEPPKSEAENPPAGEEKANEAPAEDSVKSEEKPVKEPKTEAKPAEEKNEDKKAEVKEKEPKTDTKDEKPAQKENKTEKPEGKKSNNRKDGSKE